MKKTWFGIFLFVIALLVFTGAVADESCLVYVAAKTSDRVHLRAEPSGKADSLGLYFTGTPAILRSSLHDTWVEITIGTEIGYMYNEMLMNPEDGMHIIPQWRTASVSQHAAVTCVSLHAAPFAESAVLAEVGLNEHMLMLGETVNQWCYVQWENQFGYIPSRYLSIGDSVSSSRVYDSSAQPVPFSGEWIYCSGAGAWSSVMHILPDGSFWGYYHDMDMGDDGSGYPNGTRYESIFTGRFSAMEKISEWEYRMSVDRLQVLSAIDVCIRDDVRIISSEPAGICENATFSFYVDAPEDCLPEEAAWQIGNVWGVNTGNVWGLFCHQLEALWV